MPETETTTGEIDFYFDFSSPYGYFAAARIDEVVTPFDRTVRWRPILLGPAMEKTGNRPLSDQGAKGEYSVHDWDRLARFMGLPWSLPDPFPIATVRTARTFYWIEENSPDQAKPFAMAAYKAYFGDGAAINDPETVAEIAAGLGLDRQAVLDGIEQSSIKLRLRDEVDQALEKGVFGSPYVIVDGEPFWGADRFWMIKRWLKSGGW